MKRPHRLLLIGESPKLVETFHQEDYELLCVEDRPTLSAVLAEEIFDVALITDGDGVSVMAFVETLRAQKSPTELPCLVETDVAAESFFNLQARGANDFFCKDWAQALIQRKLQWFLQQHNDIRNQMEEKKRLILAMEASKDGLWDWDLETDHVFYSWEWRMMLGLPPGDELSSPDDWFHLVHADDIGPLRSRLAVHIEGVTPNFEVQCRMRSMGQYRWMLCRGVATRNDSGKAIRVTGTLTDLTNRSLHDVRTGLPFRTFFLDRLTQAVVQSQLSENKHYSVMHVDVDRFTAISEGFGHDMVDALLVAFARRLQSCLKDGDTLAFLGGNSFVVLVEDSKKLKVARDVANQIHMQLIAPFRIQDVDVFSKASIGITLVDGHINNPDEIIRQAQTAMKVAREMGSGHTQVFDREMASKTREHLEIEGRLRSALDNEEFSLHYQPQVELANGRIVGYEALLRWKTPEGFSISPGKFIPIAEETDLILTIGEWVLRTACQQSVTWQKQGLPPMRVSVNLSERQFRARNLVGTVDHILKETGLAPDLLELEITESIFMEDVSSTLTILRDFRKRGIKIALDDFGTGFSSLSYLKKFPMTTLKIDRAFVTDLTTDAGDAAICSSIVSLAHKFNLSVIAEGVETKEQLIILRAFQCDEIQGHYFSKALPARKFEQLVEKHTRRLTKPRSEAVSSDSEQV